MDPLDEYLDLLAPFYSPGDAHQWLYSCQPLLGGARPVDLIHQGKGADVLRVIHQLRDSAYL